MHIHFLDPFRPRNSPIHRLDPRVKLVFTVAFILTNALVPTGAWPVYLLLLALILSIELISDLGMGYVLRRSLLALPFVLAAAPLIFSVPGQAFFRLHLGGVTLLASTAGMARFVSISLKSWISVQAAIVLSSSTSFPDLLVAMRALHVPRLMVAIFGLMWRYLFVLVDEAGRLLRARQARSGHSDRANARVGGSLAWRAGVTGGMAGSLFLRAFERSDRIYMAMASRGYDGEARSLPLPQVRASEWAALMASLGLLAILLAFATLVWG